jgi:hypothetical protein
MFSRKERYCTVRKFRVFRDPAHIGPDLTKCDITASKISLKRKI